MEKQHKQRILVTGSSGLIGSQLIPALRLMGFDTEGLDIRASNAQDYGDICDLATLKSKVVACAGIVHLAAISRVAIAHQNPEQCMQTNYEASKQLATLAKQAGAKWFIYASSREVYGHVESTPVAETDGLNPVNVYGEAKLKSEVAINALADEGFNPAIVRFSNVFGASNDHSTRVIPAFIKAAYLGENLNIEGGDNAFDFTFVDEVIRALTMLTSRLQQQDRFQPMHFTSGREISLKVLADDVIDLFQSRSSLIHKTPRDFDVSRFSGNPQFAEEQLGWRHDPAPLKFFLGKYAKRLGYSTFDVNKAADVGSRSHFGVFRPVEASQLGNQTQHAISNKVYQSRYR